MATAETNQDFQLIIPKDEIVLKDIGVDVTLGCHLSPSISAVAMEIRWFKETDCIYLYVNGDTKSAELLYPARTYKGRVNVDPKRLQRGDVSLTLRGFYESDRGVYTCQVISGECTHERRLKLENYTWPWDAAVFRFRMWAKRLQWREITDDERHRMGRTAQLLTVQMFQGKVKVKDQVNVQLMNPIESGANNTSLEQPQPEVQMKQSEEQLQKCRHIIITSLSGSTVKSLLDGLQSIPVISSMEAEEILQKTSVVHEQARSLIDTVLKKGDKASNILLSLLEKLDPFTYDKLGL
ncbi:uncharacterized protein LOC134468754 [Engraulis encrasicolus]|uniref:uncharacterized protein LOC134468754 n=1 Tax=Engraulis encrasicolus TaxID=184585 RepID=UPI002FD074C0